MKAAEGLLDALKAQLAVRAVRLQACRRLDSTDCHFQGDLYCLRKLIFAIEAYEP